MERPSRQVSRSACLLQPLQGWRWQSSVTTGRRVGMAAAAAHLLTATRVFVLFSCCLHGVVADRRLLILQAPPLPCRVARPGTRRSTAAAATPAAPRPHPLPTTHAAASFSPAAPRCRLLSQRPHPQPRPRRQPGSTAARKCWPAAGQQPRLLPAERLDPAGPSALTG